MTEDNETALCRILGKDKQMKLIISTAAAALIATTALAGQSDRYHDNKLDTSAHAQAANSVTPVVSTRNKEKMDKVADNTYVSKNNDSR